MVQETIAIAGSERKMGSVITQRLIRLNQYRILLLSEEEDPLPGLPDLSQQESGSDVEQVNCLKDGCWEADMIILDVPSGSFPETAEKIREVSTQKTVVILSAKEEDGPAPGESLREWQDLLPNAKLVVACRTYPDSSGIVLSGTDKESLLAIAEIIKKLGFTPVIQTGNKV